MNKTIKAQMTFTGLMVIGMASIMLTYNTIWVLGFTTDAFSAILVQLIPTFIIAFLIEQLVVGHNVFALHKRFVSPQDSQIKYIIVMALLMVTCMCSIMSLYATLVNVGTENNFWQHYVTAMARSFPVALIAQLVVVGPLVRLVHMKLFKPAAFVSAPAGEASMAPASSPSS